MFFLKPNTLSYNWLYLTAEEDCLQVSEDVSGSKTDMSSGKTNSRGLNFYIGKKPI